MPFFSFPHSSAWNVDVIVEVLSTISRPEDKGYTLGIPDQRARRKLCASQWLSRIQIHIHNGKQHWCQVSHCSFIGFGDLK